MGTTRLPHQLFLGLAGLLLVFLVPVSAQKSDLSGHRIQEVRFRYQNRKSVPRQPANFFILTDLKKGDFYHAQKVRKSMESLFRMGRFSDISVEAEKLPGKKITLTFVLKRKLRIRMVRFQHDLGLRTIRLRQAVFSLRKGSYLEDANLQNAIQEIAAILKSFGRFNPGISYRVQRDLPNAEATVIFSIKAGPLPRIDDLQLVLDQPSLKKQFTALLQSRRYIPRVFQKKIAKIRDLLKKHRHYFPTIEIQENFTTEDKSRIRLTVSIDAGYRYDFRFSGMRPKMGLIASIWENKVFEKWAETESRARILRFLNNKGYLNAEVTSAVQTIGKVKTITFSVLKKQRYALGKVAIEGNQLVRESQLRRVIKTDDQIFDRLFHLRLRSLKVDLEVLKLYYYFHGFSNAVVQMTPQFQGDRADITFQIREGDRMVVEAILIRGNQQISTKTILEQIQTKADTAFVPQRLSEDLQRIQQFYQSRGFIDAQIHEEISPGKRKSILLTIREGTPVRMGNLIIIGASRAQRAMIRSLFPLKPAAPFDHNRLNNFENELENSPTFNEIVIEEIRKDPETVDVMIKASPDYSRYYGFGLGWEDRRGFRGTLEYQQQNFLNSYSSFAALLQIGPNERRGVVSFDTPYFLHSRLNSSLRLWQEDQVYPSYKFIRTGIGQSLIHRIGSSAYISASLKWYRTRLTELDITPSGLDQVDQPFDTTVFSLLYVNDSRDNPFNPTSGEFFSSNIKVGFPLLEKEYSFYKFFWSYQKNLRLFRHGSLSFSLRNGFAGGDMSITERFFAGGIHTFRGAGNDRLGPIDSVSGEPRGGNALVILNLEASQPLLLFPVENLQYCVFTDLGNVFPKASDFSLKRLEMAIGFGIKYLTPLGPIRVDFAWNLKGKRADDPFLIKIGIGNVF